MTEPKLDAFFDRATTGLSRQKALRSDSNTVSDMVFVSVNRSFERLTGLRAADIIGKLFSEVFSQDNGFEMTLLSDHMEILLYRVVRESEKRPVHEQWIRISSFGIDDELFGSTYTDVTRTETLRRRTTGLLNVSTDILCSFDLSLRFVEISDAFTRAFGYEKEDIENISLLTMMNIDDVPQAMEIVRSIAQKRQIFGFRCLLHCKSGVFRNTEWRFSLIDAHIFASCREVEDGDESSRKSAETDAASRIDERTGLFNRDFFFRSAAAEMDRALLYNEKISILIVELEHLKTVNDTWGHPVSDDIMRQAAQLISHTVRKADIAVHFGGDEIVILLPQTTAVGATAAADKLRRILAENIRTKTGKVSASYGLAERGQDEPLPIWYKRADAALMTAKTRGHNCISAAEANALFIAPELRYGWKPELESGDRELDAQHRELLMVGRELIDMAIANVGYAETIKVVEHLVELVKQHFIYEEQLISRLKYKEYRQHSKIHQKLLGKIDFLVSSLRRQQVKSPAFYLFLTKELVYSHVEDDDARFFPLLRSALEIDSVG